jgi:hypothetical protein
MTRPKQFVGEIELQLRDPITSSNRCRDYLAQYASGVLPLSQRIFDLFNDLNNGFSSIPNDVNEAELVRTNHLAVLEDYRANYDPDLGRIIEPGDRLVIRNQPDNPTVRVLQNVC